MMKNPAEEKRYLAIDIVPSLGKAILGRLHDGKLECEEIHRFVPSFLKEDKGLPSWDIDGLISEIIKALKKAKEAGKTPDYLGIDAWGSDYVLMDEKDERIGPCFYGLEEKDSAIDAVYDILPFAELYESNGLQFQANTSIYQLMRDLKEGRLKKAKTFMMLPDYLNFLLTGKKKQEYCNGATSGLINSSTRDWDEELIEKLGYPKEIFLPLEEPGFFPRRIETPRWFWGFLWRKTSLISSAINGLCWAKRRGERIPTRNRGASTIPTKGPRISASVIKKACLASS